METSLTGFPAILLPGLGSLRRLSWGGALLRFVEGCFLTLGPVVAPVFLLLEVVFSEAEIDLETTDAAEVSAVVVLLHVEAASPVLPAPFAESFDESIMKKLREKNG